MLPWNRKILLLIVLLALADFSGASFNLFIGVDEVKTLLGLSKPNELYYVREGVPNIYALQFTVPVPPRVDALHFTWQALGHRPLPYAISMEFTESKAMITPSMNISSKGNIPTERQTFQVYFPCTGSISAEVEFELRVNVTAMTHLRTVDVTQIVLRRRRICIKDVQKGKPTGGLESLIPLGHPPLQIYSNVTATKTNGFGEGVTTTQEEINTAIGGNSKVAPNSNWIFVLMGAIFALILILVILALTGAVFAFKRRSKVSNLAECSGFLHGDAGNGSSSGSSGTSGTNISFPRPDSPHHYSTPSISHSDYNYSGYYGNTVPVYSEISSSGTYKSSVSAGDDGGSQSQKYKLAEVNTIERYKVRLQTVIEEGSFAKIYNGTVLERDGTEKKIIVKTLNENAGPEEISHLLQDGLSCVSMRQQYISSVIALAAEEKGPPYLIYADEGFRNLKRFLQRCRSAHGRSVSIQDVLHMAIQAGSGLAFLHRKNVVHRDVAARNCIVDEDLNVKVSDSALAKHLFPEDYNSKDVVELKRPIRWLAPEAVMHNKISASADVWSFGILLWELLTFAQQPYVELPVSELIGFLRKGYRLKQPINCPDKMFSVMTDCWTWAFEDRPKWSHLLPQLQKLYFAQFPSYV